MATKPTKTKLPATPKARELRAKLAALADRGVNGEKTAAQGRLSRLESRYDFSAKVMATADIFSGPFQESSVAEPVCRFKPADWDVGNGIKAAIEQAAGIPCVWRNDELLAKAAAASARRLAGICLKVSQAFVTLWTQFASAPGIHAADRANFVLGLSDGMLREERAVLPSRAARDTCTRRKAKAKAVAAPSGISLHPYSVAVQLGRQIRFEVPLDTLAGELDKAVKGEIARPLVLHCSKLNSVQPSTERTT